LRLRLATFNAENLFARTYDSTKLEEDEQRIVQFYQSQGYFTTRVTGQSVNIVDVGGGKFRLPLIHPNRPGMNANADIQTRTKNNVLAANINAVNTREKGTDKVIGEDKDKEKPKDNSQDAPKAASTDLDEVVFVLQKDGTVKKARANALATKDVIGLVFNGTIAPGAIGDVLLSGVHTASTAAWDAAFGTSGGLTEGTRYFLSDAVAGEASDQAPTADGAFVVELGQAMSPTDLRLSAPYRSIKL